LNSTIIPNTDKRVANKKLTVGHTIYAFNEGGMERGIINLINYGNHQRFRHVIICLTEGGAFSELIRSSDFRLVELHKRNGNDWHLPWAIANVARQYAIDLLHARGWPTLLETAIGARLARVPATIYGFHGKTFDDLAGASLRRRWIQRMIIKTYDRILTLTPRMRDEVAFEFGVSRQSIDLVPNGVDIKIFSPSEDQIKLRAAFGIPRGRFVIGNVGRLDPVKNQQTILRALKQLKTCEATPYFLLVGDGPERQRLQNEVRQLGLDRDVQFFGYTDHIADLMNCMDIYVQSSFYEGFSNTILEAMACGVPVLATNVGGTSDLFESGREGFFFEPKDHDSLASLITRLLTDQILLQEMGRRARKRTIDVFAVEKTVALYESIYMKLHST
jgi:sugar transferase (PEP-CTERM/EpsH1 system associated)